VLSSIEIDWNKLKIKIMLKEACQNLQCGRRVEAAIDFPDRHIVLARLPYRIILFLFFLRLKKKKIKVIYIYKRNFVTIELKI